MFKKCGLCTLEWRTCQEFLSDPENRFEGYVYLKNRALDGVPVEGLLLFTHRREKCGTTLAIAASRFRREGVDGSARGAVVGDATDEEPTGEQAG